MLTKQCLFCGKTIVKRQNCSLKDWNETKFCSKRCHDNSRKGKPLKWLKKYQFKKGKSTWNKGLTKENDERARKSSERMKANNPMKRKDIKEKSSISHTGYIMPEKQRIKLSETHKKRVEMGLNNLYIHGNYLKNRGQRFTIDYKIWRSKVFRRDNYTCQNCGARSEKKKTVYLEAHHLKSWAKFSELRFEIDNGQTLCDKCHKLTDNYGKKSLNN